MKWKNVVWLEKVAWKIAEKKRIQYSQSVDKNRQYSTQ